VCGVAGLISSLWSEELQNIWPFRLVLTLPLRCGSIVPKSDAETNNRPGKFWLTAADTIFINLSKQEGSVLRFDEPFDRRR